MSPSHTFHVYSEGGTSLNIVVLGNDDRTPAYKMQYNRTSTFRSKHDMDVVRLGPSRGWGSSPGTLVGTIAHRKLSSKLDLSVHNKPTAMESNGTFKSGGYFTSTFPGVGVLKWQKDGMFSGPLVLVDSGGTKFARFALSYFTTKKMATIEILMNPMPSPQVLDEIVVSGLAVSYELNRGAKGSHHRAARGVGVDGGSGGGGDGGGGGGSC